MRNEVVIRVSGKNDYTPGEEWTVGPVRGSHYGPLVGFVLERLGAGEGRRCLVVGSPLFEAEELVRAGWAVSFVDVRRPPESLSYEFIQADAASADLGEGVFDVASSTCVLCHAGMGRYGDPVVEDGDERLLANISRSLKVGARAVIAFGPIASLSLPAKIDNAHRVYNFETAEAMANAAGFEILEKRVLDSYFSSWKDFEREPPTAIQIGRDYLTMVLVKK